MAAFVTFRELAFLGDKDEYIEGSWIYFNSAKSVMRLLQKQAISIEHPSVMYWENKSSKVRKCKRKLNDQWATRSRVLSFAFSLRGLRHSALANLPPYYKTTEGKINLLSIFSVRPKSSRSQSTASPSKNGKGSPPDPEPDPERPISLGFSVYQTTPAAPPFAI